MLRGYDAGFRMLGLGSQNSGPSGLVNGVPGFI